VAVAIAPATCTDIVGIVIIVARAPVYVPRSYIRFNELEVNHALLTTDVWLHKSMPACLFLNSERIYNYTA
jgi:hypothetical protein